METLFDAITDENRWEKYFEIGRVVAQVDERKQANSSTGDTEAYFTELNEGISIIFLSFERKWSEYKASGAEAGMNLTGLQQQAADLYLCSPWIGDRDALRSKARTCRLTRNVQEHLDDGLADLETIYDRIGDLHTQFEEVGMWEYVSGPHWKSDREVPVEDIAFISRPVDTARDISEDACPICLEQFTEREKVVAAACDHCIHSECLTLWSNSKTGGRNLCPCCRNVTFDRKTGRPDVPLRPAAVPTVSPEVRYEVELLALDCLAKRGLAEHVVVELGRLINELDPQPSPLNVDLVPPQLSPQSERRTHSANIWAGRCALHR
jgi:hypothetical protein